MIDLKRKLSKKEEEHAEEILRNWNEISKASEKLSLEDWQMLICHELQSRRRMTVLTRLVSRYSSLEQAENEKLVMSAASK
jgi:uncharacterized protein YecA (UPF0149 family)